MTAKLRSGPCVPALREAVKSWKAGGRNGTTDTTRVLLNYWFEASHKTRTGFAFKYYEFQREAIETLIYVWEVEKVRSRKDLLERYAQNAQDLHLPPEDGFARYCTKMATGSGKTKVMALAIAWQYFNAVREQDEIAKDYAKTFLLIAPNVIVLERLKADFAAGKIFREDPIRPKEFDIFWDFDCVMRGEGERAHSEGVLFLTNIHQFYERADRSEDDEPDAITAVLGPKPPAQKQEQMDFAGESPAAPATCWSSTTRPTTRMMKVANGTPSSKGCMRRRLWWRSSTSLQRRASANPALFSLGPSRTTH